MTLTLTTGPALHLDPAARWLADDQGWYAVHFPLHPTEAAADRAAADQWFAVLTADVARPGTPAAPTVEATGGEALTRLRGVLARLR